MTIAQQHIAVVSVESIGVTRQIVCRLAHAALSPNDEYAIRAIAWLLTASCPQAAAPVGEPWSSQIRATTGTPSSQLLVTALAAASTPYGTSDATCAPAVFEMFASASITTGVPLHLLADFVVAAAVPPRTIAAHGNYQNAGAESASHPS